MSAPARIHSPSVSPAWVRMLMGFLGAAMLAGTSPACTIGVAAGRATSDGRSLLWKSRDQGEYPDNQAIYVASPSNPYAFVAVANAGDTLAWMGVNEAGFAIVNSNSLDLCGRSLLTNGSLMHHALGHCATAAEFSNFLRNTCTDSLRDVHANYGVIDAAGAAWMFEVEDTLFWAYDADAGEENPEGFIVRTNFSMAGGGANGIARYVRSVALISDLCASGSLNYRTVTRLHLRDFSDEESEPIPIPYPGQWNENAPYGYIWTHLSICREGTVSGVVIRGIEPGQPPWRTTMWTLLGQPASAIAIPLWPVGTPPGPATGAPTAPLCDVANLVYALLFDWYHPEYLDSYKLRTESGHGFWPPVFAVEDSLFAHVDMLDRLWHQRLAGVPNPVEASEQLANQALTGLQYAYEALAAAQPVDGLFIEPTSKGMVLRWEPVLRSKAGTPLVVDIYDAVCTSSPNHAAAHLLRFRTAAPECFVPSPRAGFFCQITAWSSGIPSPGPWILVCPLER